MADRLSSLERGIAAHNEAELAIRGGFKTVDWPTVNGMEAAIRATGLRHGLAGELALGLWLAGQPFTVMVFDPQQTDEA